MSLRGTDVAAMMTRVEATLAGAEDSPEGRSGALVVAPEGDTELNVAALRRHADIRVDFPPGSGRPVVGPVVRLGKRALRRAVRWYVTPMMEQQSTLNHALLDGMERLRLRIERLRPPPSRAGARPLVPRRRSCRGMAVGPSAAAMADLLAGPMIAADGIEVVAGDPLPPLSQLHSGGLDLLAADVSGMGPEALIDLLRTASAALAPGAVVVLSSMGAPGGASIHRRAQMWALESVGFEEAHTRSLESIAAPAPDPTASSTDLVARLVRVDEAVRSDVEVVVAWRTP